MELGKAIHERRKRLGLTLEVLARGSGVSRAMLSDVERGKRSPTINILSQIAVGLGCRVAELLEEPSPAVLHVERAPQHPVVHDPATGVERRTLGSPLLGPGLELVWYGLPPGTWIRRSCSDVRYGAPGVLSGSYPPNPFGTVEHVVVLQGAVTCHAGHARHELAPGDSVNYRLTDDVEFHNGLEALARLAMVLDTRPMGR